MNEYVHASVSSRTEWLKREQQFDEVFGEVCRFVGSGLQTSLRSKEKDQVPACLIVVEVCKWVDEVKRLFNPQWPALRGFFTNPSEAPIGYDPTHDLPQAITVQLERLDKILTGSGPKEVSG